MAKTVALYCSSHSPLPAETEHAATDFGTMLGEEGHALVYGGVRKGLMELAAQAARRHGAQVLGIVPRYMQASGLVSSAVTDVRYCDGLAERKALMQEAADVFVALPGGIGTIDEVMSAWATATVGEHNKSIYLLNILHHWDAFVAAIQGMVTAGHIHPDAMKNLHVVDNVEALRMALRQ